LAIFNVRFAIAVKYSVITFGCRVNQADAMGFEEEFLARGDSPSAPDEADVVVVNTCSVTASADQGARQTIRRIARANPSARVIVTGCYATRSPDDVAQLPNVAGVVPNDGKAGLVSLARGVQLRPDVGPTTAERFGDGGGSCGASIQPGVAGRTAFTLRVQTGCAEPCSYCIIPTTRGRPRSVPVDDVLREVERVAAAGFKEIALTGVHLGSYGRDLAPSAQLVDLLSALDHTPSFPDVLFRVSSLEPMDCTSEIVALVAASRSFAPHFHLPMQHASNRLLSAMRRPYTIERYQALVGGIRTRIPHAAIGTDVIVGFPGETEDDFASLADYLAQSPLTHVHVFPYSDRPGTPAASMDGKVPGAAVRERAGRIREVSDALSRRFRKGQVGSVLRGLTLDDGTLVVTGNYLKVRIPEGFARNEWVTVRLLDAGNGLIGSVEGQRGEPLRGRALLALDDELSAGGADVSPAALPH
jgi:threonylcarbamoyladenosine tRNA methylthiotransferase MtaB